MSKINLSAIVLSFVSFVSNVCFKVFHWVNWTDLKEFNSSIDSYALHGTCCRAVDNSFQLQIKIVCTRNATNLTNVNTRQEISKVHLLSQSDLCSESSDEIIPWKQNQISFTSLICTLTRIEFWWRNQQFDQCKPHLILIMQIPACTTNSLLNTLSYLIKSSFVQ
jgi:hypothetical protein